MLDIGWSEMGLILLVALVVIGPKDLPRVARTVGKWSAKARGMAREFQRSLDDMAREAELQDIKAEIDKVNRTDLRARIEETVDPEGELRRAIQPPRFDDPSDMADSPDRAAAGLAAERAEADRLEAALPAIAESRPAPPAEPSPPPAASTPPPATGAAVPEKV